MITRARAGLVAAALVLAGTLAGCGDNGDGGDNGEGSGNDFADQGYDEIRDAAIEAMASLDSVHFSLNVVGEEQSSKADLSMSADGSCTGTLSAGQASTQVLRVGDAGWFKPNRAYLEQFYPGKAEQAAEFVGDKWVADTDGRTTGANCDLAGLVDSLSQDLAVGAGTAPQVGQGGGPEVVSLDFSGERGSGSALVLVEGEHYIVRTTRAGVLATFSEFNEPVDTERPSASEVVDLADFAG
jgi:hypothetical protein